MANKTLVGEFHADHTKVMRALMALRSAIKERNPAGVREILGEANKLIGPHFKFEELYLYPSLLPYLGRGGVNRLLTEHDGVFRGVAALLEMTNQDTWSQDEADMASDILEQTIWEHPITCDGLSLLVEMLPEEVQASHLCQMEELRKEGRTLLEYRQERA